MGCVPNRPHPTGVDTLQQRAETNGVSDIVPIMLLHSDPDSVTLAQRHGVSQLAAQVGLGLEVPAATYRRHNSDHGHTSGGAGGKNGFIKSAGDAHDAQLPVSKPFDKLR